MPGRLSIMLWLAISVGLTGVLSYALPGTDNVSQLNAVYLPGETTHGHYQIELRCGACHTPLMGVREDACIQCHGDDLKASRDTHPASKFNDPVNAERLKILDAKSCLTCHKEHVPEQTHPMGLTIPEDYCFRCHETIGDDRPSHKGMAYNTCATAGCHNYHDNLALYEKFLSKHVDEQDVLDDPHVPPRKVFKPNPSKLLNKADHDAPQTVNVDDQLLQSWADSAHAKAGVNCTKCHTAETDSEEKTWSNTTTLESCQSCHKNEANGWLAGKHGMRLAQGMSPMTPGKAILPMKHSSFHNELNCQSCHSAHDYNTQTAAVDACVKCHDDQHSNAYLDSSHYELWKQELAGNAKPGSGVSCATCHMPRVESEYGDSIHVEHNQNWNLEPNEKMARSVCMNCHGLQFTLDSLADSKLINNGFQGQPKSKVKSIQMADDWFKEKQRKAEARKRKNTKKTSKTTPK